MEPVDDASEETAEQGEETETADGEVAEVPEGEAEEDDAEAGADGKDEPEPSDSEKRLATLEADLKVERIARERAELIARRAQLHHDRLAGEFSRFKTQAKARATSDGDGEEAEPDPDETELAAEREEDSRTSLMNAEEHDFIVAHPDILPLDDDSPEVKAEKLAFVEDLRKEIAKNGQSYKADLLSGSPKRMRAAARDALREAYLTVKERKERIRADEIAGRRKVAEETNRQAKKLVTPVGTKKVAATARTPKDPSELTLEEVTAALKREGRRGF